MPDLPLSPIQGGIPNGSAAPGNPLDAEGQVLVTAPSNGADLDVSAHGLLSIDSLFDRDSASVSRSGHNQQRDWSVPVRAAHSNRPDCDTITTNYEEAFGSIHPVCLRRSPIPGSGRNLVTRDGYSQFSSYSNGTPSKHQVSPTNLPSNKQGLDRMGRPTECELQNARCKPAIDETTPPIFEGSHIRSTPSVENRPQSTFKHNSIPTHPKPVSNEVSASGIQTAGNSYPSSPSALEKISAGINLSAQQPLLAIVVDSGIQTQTFVVHKSVGIQSPLFRDAFDASSNQQSEHAMRTMTLPDSDALAFGLLVNWLYTGRIEPAGGCPLRLIEAAKLWTVAGRCQLPTLQNKALTLIFTAFEDPDGEEVLSPEEDDVKEFCRHVYETSDKTPLKRLAVDEMMDIVSTGNVELWLKDLPKGMQGDFTRALVKRLENVPEHTFEDKNAFHYFVPDF